VNWSVIEPVPFPRKVKVEPDSIILPDVLIEIFLLALIAVVSITSEELFIVNVRIVEAIVLTVILTLVLITTSFPVPGTVLVDQFKADAQLLSPAPPSHVTVCPETTPHEQKTQNKMRKR
jgi:hypothetical protein